MRVFEKLSWKNRWGYAGAAFLTAGLSPVLVFFAFKMVIDPGNFPNLPSASNTSNDNSWREFIETILLLGIPASLAATICWPFKSERTPGRMMFAGVCTVIITIVFLAVAIQYSSSRPFEIIHFIESTVFLIFVVSLFSLGLPYGLAMAVSLLFTDKEV